LAALGARLAPAQNVTATVAVGGNPSAIAVNPVTNKIYVEIGGDNVAVIDGATNSFTTFNAGSVGSMAVNPVTNKVYISNGPFSGIPSPQQISVVDGETNAATVIAPGSAGPTAVNPVTDKVYVSTLNGVTVIDGATNAATSVAAEGTAGAVAVNLVTNTIYVANSTLSGGGTVPYMMVIDGTSNQASVVYGAGAGPIAVNTVTNAIYVANEGYNDVIVIDGATNGTAAVPLGINPSTIALNPVTNTIYVGSFSGNAVTAIDGATNATTTIPVGPGTQEIVVNPVTNQVYVLDASDVTVIDGATNATSTLAIGTTPQDIAVNPVTGNVYVANNGSGDVTVIGGAPVPSAPPAARLTNLSVRAQVGTGADILIPGFVVTGRGAETLLIRADGPSLALFGVPGLLAQPSLAVFDSAGTMVASNTGWGANSNPTQIAAVAAQVGAFPLPSGSADCALLVTLPPGTYTAHISGVNNTVGVALAEVYEVSSTGTRLVNLSTRAQVGSGANIIIPGFVVSGGSEDLLVRANGPALAQYSVAGFLDRPNLSVFDSSGALKAANSGWASADIGLIAGFDAAVGAFPLQPGSADSAQVVRLAPGGYTIQVSSLDSSTGVALAEVYEAP
jgi:YVTN family beta-propeller protein